MKKDNMFTVFMRGFVKSFLVIIILLGVGFGSYQLTMLYYKVVEPPKDSQTNDLISDIVNDVDVEDISNNLIYRINSETGEVTGLVLEIFNTYTYNLDYITIPADTEFTISNETYQKLRTVNTEAPQIIKLANLNQYFEESDRYDYGIILIEDLISADINYYTVMNESDFDGVFQDQNGIWVMNTEFEEQVSGITDKEQLNELITGLYDTLKSNLTLKNKLKYSDSFLNISSEYIHYYSLQGTAAEDSFTVDVDSSNGLIQDILSNEAYTEGQETITGGAETVSSMGLNIEILNGSNISGLAAAYQDKLVADGFTVSHIGNYSDNSVTSTTIYVKEDGQGQDLLSYFNGASIQTGDLAEGTDIQIVLGSMDQLQ